MPSIRVSLATTVVLALSATTLTGCGPEPPHETGAIAFVIGGRNNMPRPSLIGAAQRLHDDAVLSNDTMIFIGVSGRPEVLFQQKVDQSCDSDKTCGATVAQYQRQTAGVLAKIRATDPEADLLSAIELAARSVRAVDAKGPKQVVVVDSGVQTAGDLKLQSPGALTVDPAAQAKAMKEAGKLRFLDGLGIHLAGLGTSWAPQTPLSSADTLRLEKLWTAVLSEGGAKVEVESAVLPQEAPTPGLPAVSVLAPDVLPQPSTPCFRVRDDQVGFLPNSSTFRDPAAARKTLEPVAESLLATNGAATVVGTTALPEKNPDNPLSKARAQAVIDVLTELDVPRELLKGDGVGIEFAGYVRPYDDDGHFDEILAVQNRQVIIQQIGQPCR